MLPNFTYLSLSTQGHWSRVLKVGGEQALWTNGNAKKDKGSHFPFPFSLFFWLNFLATG